VTAHTHTHTHTHTVLTGGDSSEEETSVGIDCALISAVSLRPQSHTTFTTKDTQTHYIHTGA